MKKLLWLLSLGICMAVPGTGMAADYYGKQKVVYDLNTGDARLLNAALGNIQNHLDAVGKNNIDLIVVIHGAGLDLLTLANNDRTLQNKITSLKKAHVAFKVCNTTLAAKHIPYKTALFDVRDEDIVPSGVAEIARLQTVGYIYIKP